MAMKIGELELTFTRPDDWHVHVRDGEMMWAVVGRTARQFRRGLIMPNLKPPVTTVGQAIEYQRRILSTLPKGSRFEPLMTLYLTDGTSPEEIVSAKKSGLIHAVKLYPAGATTNSSEGVTDIEKVYPVLEKMEERDIALCVHGEVTDPKVDIFDREKFFIDRALMPLVGRFPKLRIVFEHITTAYGALYVEAMGPNVAATITAHHLLENRNAIFRGGLNPHVYCLPVLKREQDRVALVRAATSGLPKFFLGSDTAPHAKGAKESECGCAGCFTAYAAIELYAEAFELAGELDKLEGFASHFGADFYGLPRNTETITLVREPWQIPKSYSFSDDDVVVPFWAGKELQWKMQ